MKKFGCIKSELDGSEYIYSTTPSKLPEQYTYQHILNPVVNQGNQNICVSCSLDCYLNWNQNLLQNTPNKNNRFNITYKDMTADGIQIKQALSQLLHTNYISGYYKVPNIELAKAAIMINGPIVGGLPVYNSNITEFWKKYSQNIEGYHCVTFVGFNPKGFILRNSWGKSYGQNGYSILEYPDVDKIIELWTLKK